MSKKKLVKNMNWKEFLNPFRSISMADFLHSNWSDRFKQTILVMSGMDIAPTAATNTRPDNRFYVIDYFLLATRQLMILLSDLAEKKAKAYLESRRYSFPDNPYNLKLAALFLAKYVTKGLYLLWTYPIRYTVALLLTPIALLLLPIVTALAKCTRFLMDKSLLLTLRVKSEDNLKNTSTSLLCKRLWGEKYYSLRDLNIHFDAKNTKCLVEIYSSKLQRNVTYSFLSKNPQQLFERISLAKGSSNHHKIFSKP